MNIPVECSIVIPVFNRVDFTRQCLAALFADPPNIQHEILIVDNNSTDGTKEYLQTWGDRIRVITNASNLGFAKACNQGAKEARGTHVIFLNNDTLPLHGWLDELICNLKSDHSIGAAGSKLLYPDSTIQHAGIAFSLTAINDEGQFVGPYILPYNIYRYAESSAPYVNKKRIVPAVTGACMLVSRSVFDWLKGFDENYINGYEDVDFCLKLMQAGLKTLYCPTSILFHYEGKSRPPESIVSQRIYVKNSRYFMEKWPHLLRENDVDICKQDGTTLDVIRRNFLKAC